MDHVNSRLDSMGCDIDARMVGGCQGKCSSSRCRRVISCFKQMRVQDLRTDKINGIVISNPPYEADCLMMHRSYQTL